MRRWLFITDMLSHSVGNVAHTASCNDDGRSVVIAYVMCVFKLGHRTASALRASAFSVLESDVVGCYTCAVRAIFICLCRVRSQHIECVIFVARHKVIGHCCQCARVYFKGAHSGADA